MNITLLNALSIAIGASLGAWGRWLLGLMLNQLFPHLPLGTLITNLVGGFLMGIVLALLEIGHLEIAHWRLFVTTGFLGGLTTFSAFTGESLVLLQKQEYGWAIMHTSSHVLGALLCAAFGFWLMSQLRA
jgi:CrcB protein